MQIEIEKLLDDRMYFLNEKYDDKEYLNEEQGKTNAVVRELRQDPKRQGLSYSS